ncbi:MAG: phage holin family protein [Tepidisphaeraceae bacterium]|jgi:hypothetical protein
MEPTEKSSEPVDSAEGGVAPTSDAGDPMNGFHEHFAEMGEYVNQYVAAKIDLGRFHLRRFVFRVLLFLLFVLAGAGLIVTAVVLACNGLAHGLGALLGHQWIADLITGLVLLVSVYFCLWVAFRRFQDFISQRVAERYEDRRNMQRQRFGHDAANLAEEQETDHGRN